MNLVVKDDCSETNLTSSFLDVFNALAIGPEYLWTPERLVPFNHWIGHIPFSFWIVKTLRPKVFVELGTHRGNSYCAMCQTASSLQIPAAGYAVDTWLGDLHMAFEASIFDELSHYHDPKYGSFSTLINSTFDDALTKFSDGQIDLLHIDGTHTYEAVSHDFERWLPKLSNRGVVILHDIIERQADFGVWRLWEELRGRYPSFEFRHSHGLGVISTGHERPAALEALFQFGKSEDAGNQVRKIFETRGQSFLDLYLANETQRAAQFEAESLTRFYEEKISALNVAHLDITNEARRAAQFEAESLTRFYEEKISTLNVAHLADLANMEDNLRYQKDELRSEIEALLEIISGLEEQARLTARQREFYEYERQGLVVNLHKATTSGALARARALLADEKLRRVEAENMGLKRLQEKALVTRVEIVHLPPNPILDAELENLRMIEQSTIWRSSALLRSVATRLPRPVRRIVRRSLKVIWWTASGRLLTRIRQYRRG